MFLLEILEKNVYEFARVYLYMYFILAVNNETVIESSCIYVQPCKVCINHYVGIRMCLSIIHRALEKRGWGRGREDNG